MNRLTLLLIFIPSFLFGQQYKKITTLTDTFFVLNSVDTLTIPQGLPDGKWKVFFDSDTSRPQYIFYLRDNKVNGFFMSYYPSGAWAKIGSYKNDSLWTFKPDNFSGNDTTFKIALWKYQSGNYPMGDLHKIPFNKNDSIYTDKWYYKNGQLLSERIYHKTNALIKETWFYENGDKSSMFEKHNGYSIKTEWTKDQKVSNLYLDQKFSFQLQLDTNNIRYIPCSDCIVQTVFDKKGNFISSVSIDTNGKVRNFSGGGVTLRYDTDGNVKSIQYWNKKEKYRLKKLK